MKCPHCGMNIRDNITDCGYCGGKIVQESEKSTTGAGRPNISGGSTAEKGAAKNIQSGDEEPETDEEGEGGLSVYLQKGEHVLIGSLNITVKKFFFHAYLTDRRIFLIDTQEKKVKVTAKDIPRDSIIGSIIEFSENSDPVLVLSIRSPDDEIKTMKLVFVQNGMERSDEIDEWIALLHEKDTSKSPEPQAEEIPVHEEKAIPAEPGKPAEKQELHPKRTPAKDHEKQPPVKRHLAARTVQEQEAPVPEPARRRAQVREVPEQESGRGATPAKAADVQTVRKREVQSAMKVAMKSAMQPLKHSSLQMAKRPVIEPEAPSAKEPEPAEKKVSPRRPVVQEKPAETPVHDESADIPQYCHNCGKKLPLAANFCPGCGTKLSLHRTLPHARVQEAPAEKKAPHHPAPAREKKVSQKEEIDEEEKENETPVPTKPPVRKLPKGSEMTILHKFLRR
jgi:zinc-ribbon domain